MDVMHHLYHHPPPHTTTPPSSKLNPNAPIFIPMKSYLTVEDFSDEWWDLVHSSPFFRDYWLNDSSFAYDDEHYSSENAPAFLPDNDDLLLPDFDAFFDLYLHHQQQPQEEEREGEEEEKREKELITLGSLKWSKSPKVEPLRCIEKVPKIVKNVKMMNPRAIHQPR